MGTNFKMGTNNQRGRTIKWEQTIKLGQTIKWRRTIKWGRTKKGDEHTNERTKISYKTSADAQQRLRHTLLLLMVWFTYLNLVFLLGLAEHTLLETVSRLFIPATVNMYMDKPVCNLVWTKQGVV